MISDLVMAKVITQIIRIFIAGVISVFLLSAFILVYSNTGVHINNPSRATDYKWEPNQFKSTMAEGFSWIRFNEDGFNNSFALSAVDGIDILLMGSSHMEAANVAWNENSGCLLNEHLPDMVTYNIGISGHDIYRCAENLEAAVNYYHPRKYVIIETDRVMLEPCRISEVIDGKLLPIPSHDSGLVYTVQKYIPCVLPIYRELDNWKNAGKPTDSDLYDDVETNHPDADYEARLYQFMGMISESAGDCKVIIVYHPVTVLDDNGELFQDNDEYVRIFEESCNDNGIVFVNMYDDFLVEYVQQKKLAHGFSNTAVGTGHLNEVGHALISNRLAACLEELEHGVE